MGRVGGPSGTWEPFNSSVFGEAQAFIPEGAEVNIDLSGGAVVYEPSGPPAQPPTALERAAMRWGSAGVVTDEEDQDA